MEAIPGKNPRGSETPLTLGDLRPGARARVISVAGRGELARRIADLGVNIGVVVEVERVAPMGDPIEIRVRGYHLALRLSEARQISVVPA